MISVSTNSFDCHGLQRDINSCSCCFLGPRVSMFVGALCYTLYISTFAYYPSRASILATSAILGVAAGVLWTAQVCCLILGVVSLCVHAHCLRSLIRETSLRSTPRTTTADAMAACSGAM